MAKRVGSFEPELPAPPETRMTPEQYQAQQDFFFGQVERFKRMFEDSTLAKYIIMAGVTGMILAVIEVGRVLVELVVFFRRTTP